MSLPPLPNSWDEGYDWMDQLYSHTLWRPVASWGSMGWDLGSWPYVIVAHYDGDRYGQPDVFGQAVYVESDITVQEFESREARDKATDETAVWYWARDDESPTAPKTMDDPRVGPYEG